MTITHDELVCASILILAITAKPVETSAVGNKIIPSPLVIAPSQYWDGVDGTWSSFALRVGQPTQNVRVHVSTNSPETMVVLPEGCTSAVFDPPSNCANSRGQLFNETASTTWQFQGLYGINQDNVGFEANLGYSQNASYGLETLGLGYGGANEPTLEGQTIAAIASTSPFYLGLFGLGTQPVNYTTIGNFSAPSYFSSLRSKDIIPSLSWSYTAGAKYRMKAGQYAQLIFGGFDISRFVSNSASFSLAPDIDRDIVVAIQSITFSGTTQEDLLATPVYAFIESTDPNIWLPDAVCTAFEKAFGISVDNSTGLYLLNSTQVAQLQSTQVTFSLSDSLSSGETVRIVLPFSALALQASYPFIPKDTNRTVYFPLKRAANETQITLGRTFLQEAYLTVDYERGNFSVSQCLWNDGAAAEISAILSPSYEVNSTSTSQYSTASSIATPSSKSLSPGAIAGITITIILALGVLTVVAYFYFRRRHHAAAQPPTEHANLGQTAQYYNPTMPQSPGPPYSPFLAEKKFDILPIIRGRAESELPSTSEIQQLPDHDNRTVDYVTAMQRIESRRRAANTPEIAGTGVTYELQGSEPAPVELDGESNKAMTPMTPRRQDTLTTSSSRPMSPMSPLTPLSEDRQT